MSCGEADKHQAIYNHMILNTTKENKNLTHLSLSFSLKNRIKCPFLHHEILPQNLS
jgi:hypothetical protein